MSGAAFSIAKMIKTALAVLMMVTAFMPALAEAGCLQEGISYMEVAGDARGEGDQVIENSSQNDNGPASQSQPAHCAFNHCANGFTVPAANAVGVDHRADKEKYLWAIVRALATTAPEKPYHPPQA